jgi:serine phosphatase RsbU (regulator of sigma subunit)/HAMP domain-containing protein
MMITVTYIFTIRELNLRREQVTLRMEQLANNIATIRTVETEDWDIYQNYINTQLKLNLDIVYIAIFDEQGALKVHTLNTDWLELDNQEMLSTLDQANIVLRLDQRQLAEESQKDLESQSVEIIIGEQNLGIVKVGFSLIELNDEMRNNLSRNLLLGVIFTMAAILISFIISNRIVIPITRLTKAMINISRGNLGQQVHINSKDEIGEMAETFNFMTRGLQEKEVIENFSRELGFTIELEKISKLITRRIAVAVNSGKAYFFLRDHKDDTRMSLVSAHPSRNMNELSIAKNDKLCRYFLKNAEPVTLSAAPSFPGLDDALKMFKKNRSQTLLCPLIIKDNVVGLLTLGPKKDNAPYSSEELSFLATLIRQGGFAVESALLYAELTEQERMKRELEIARMVQQSLLPQNNPQLNGLDIDGICLPANEVGGDYYDYFSIDKHRIGVAIADVTGKGTPAAFYMAVVKGIMLSLTSFVHSPKALLQELNKRLYGNMDPKVFITMIYGVFDLRSKQLTFARAGHNALIMKKAANSEVESLTPAGIGLGLEKGEIFNKTIMEEMISYSQGDTFIFYTDGISEAMNPKKEEFGEHKLISLVNQKSTMNSRQIRESVIIEIKKFAQNQPQHDDITMVTVIAT